MQVNYCFFPWFYITHITLVQSSIIFLLTLATECFMKDIIFCWMLYAEEEKSFISVHYMWASSSAFSPVTMVTAVFE